MAVFQLNQGVKVKTRKTIAVALSLAVGICAAGMAGAAEQEEKVYEIPQPTLLPGQPMGALARENLAKPRPAPPFDMTGNWMFNSRMNRDNGVSEYWPLPKFTPATQASYEAAKAAAQDGQAYKNDEGQCWPAGMPKMMNRVWPNQTIQLPTMILMMQMLKHEVRWIYLDGRPHGDPEIKPASYSGDSIGWWEGDTLVVETVNLEPSHHWIQPGVPVGPKLKIIERMRLKQGGDILEVDYTMTDPDNWEGEWKSTKVWFRYDQSDVEEALCLPDLNDNLLSTQTDRQVR